MDAPDRKDRKLDAAEVERRAREAYTRQHPHAAAWDDLPDFMQLIWRRHVTTGVPPR